MAAISPPCCDPEVPVDATTVTEEVGQRDESLSPLPSHLFTNHFSSLHW